MFYFTLYGDVGCYPCAYMRCCVQCRTVRYAVLDVG